MLSPSEVRALQKKWHAQQGEMLIARVEEALRNLSEGRADRFNIPVTGFDPLHVDAALHALLSVGWHSAYVNEGGGSHGVAKHTDIVVNVCDAS